jgi:hypothetical protein
MKTGPRARPIQAVFLEAPELSLEIAIPLQAVWIHGISIYVAVHGIIQIEANNMATSYTKIELVSLRCAQA